MITWSEEMPDEECYKSRHDAKIGDFSDEEIVKEFNRRLNQPLFHNIGIIAKAIIKKKKKINHKNEDYSEYKEDKNG